MDYETFMNEARAAIVAKEAAEGHTISPNELLSLWNSSALNVRKALFFGDKNNRLYIVTADTLSPAVSVQTFTTAD